MTKELPPQNIVQDLSARADGLRIRGAALDNPETNMNEIREYCKLLCELYFDAAMAGLYTICDRVLAYRDRINPEYTPDGQPVEKALSRLCDEVLGYVEDEYRVLGIALPTDSPV